MSKVKERGCSSEVVDCLCSAAYTEDVSSSRCSDRDVGRCLTAASD